jgi:hypothetical protein
MAGIMPALKADNDVGLLGEPVDNFAFALVAPLTTRWFGFRLQPLVPIMDDAGRSKEKWLSAEAGNLSQ